MAEKDDPPKAPQPQNTDAPDRPRVPENRLVTGEGRVPGLTALDQSKK